MGRNSSIIRYGMPEISAGSGAGPIPCPGRFNMLRLEARIKAEAQLLAKYFGRVNYSTEGSWILVYRWPLPPKVFHKDYTPLLIAIPPGYPSVPPNGVYMTNSLH